MISQSLQAVEGFARWWVGELASMLPAGLANWFTPRADTLVVALDPQALVVGRDEAGGWRPLLTVDRAELDAAAARGAVAALLKKGERGATIRLPADAVLRRVLDLPLATERRLAQILEFEIDRQTPFLPEQVYSAHRIVGRDGAGERLRIEWFVVPRAAVDEAVETVGRLGIHVVAVDVAGPAAGVINLLPQQGGRPDGRRAGFRLTVALAALATLLAVAVVVFPLWRDAQRLAALDAAIAALRAEALAAAKLRDELARLDEDSRFLDDRKRAVPAISRLLNDVTRVVPDNSWLMELQITEQGLRIAGFSASASALIAAIEQSGRFRNARFSSPVTQGLRGEGERFNISFEMTSEGTP